MSQAQSVKSGEERPKILESQKVSDSQLSAGASHAQLAEKLSVSNGQLLNGSGHSDKPSESPLKSGKVFSSSDTSKSLEEAVKSSIAGAPIPSESAIEAHQAREQAREELETGSKGGVKAGTKRGPYKTSKNTESKLSGISPKETVRNDNEKFRKIGREIADTLIIAGRTLGGEDWEPKLIKAGDEILFDERSNLREAWADMSEEYQWEKFPAWAGVTIASLAYIVPRLNAPSTVSRMEKLKLWWTARKIKKQDEAQAKANERRPDSA